MSSASVSSGVCVVRPSSVVYVILVFRPYVSWKTSSHVEMVHLWIISSLKHVVCWFRRGDDPPSINERRRRHVLRGVFAFMTHFAPLFDVCLFFIHPPCLFSQPLCVCALLTLLRNLWKHGVAADVDALGPMLMCSHSHGASQKGNSLKLGYVTQKQSHPKGQAHMIRNSRVTYFQGIASLSDSMVGVVS